METRNAHNTHQESRIASGGGSGRAAVAPMRMLMRDAHCTGGRHSMICHREQCLRASEPPKSPKPQVFFFFLTSYIPLLGSHWRCVALNFPSADPTSPFPLAFPPSVPPPSSFHPTTPSPVPAPHRPRQAPRPPGPTSLCVQPSAPPPHTTGGAGEQAIIY
jgi:hypothetical protein